MRIAYIFLLAGVWKFITIGERTFIVSRKGIIVFNIQYPDFPKHEQVHVAKAEKINRN